MNLKKFAVRGIVTLAVFVALCMFFSGTVRTITTPKVQLTTARRGKLEERVQLSCKLAFPQVEQVEIDLPEDTSLTITKVNSREGYSVKAGDVVVQAKVSNYEQQRRQYQEAYESASEQLMTLENKNRGIRINRRDEAYADAYFGLRDARRAMINAELEMDAQLSREGLSRTEEGYPEGASDALKKAMDEWRASQTAMAAAQQTMDDASRYTVEDTVWAYISEKREQEEKMAEAEESLRALMALNERAQAFTASHDGYVAELTLKEGDTCDGSQSLFAITAEGALPVLRAETDELERSVSEGMTATLNEGSYDAIDSQVIATGTDAEGKKYADIELTEAMIRERGSVYAMMQEETPMTLVYRARDASSLLPTNAVRGSDDQRYVYIVEQNTAAFGGNTLKLRKLEVKVIGEYGGVTALQDDISYYQVAYGEDRAVSEGDVVMQYLD